MMFADVILPLALNRLYTYTVAEHLKSDIAVGKRVLVQFGKQKIYSALVRKIHEQQPAYETKEIIEVLDDDAVISSKQFQLWDWISEYYMCSLGEVMSASLPSALKLESESTVTLNPEFSGDDTVLNDREYLIYEALQMVKSLPLKEVQKIVGIKTVFRILKSMAEKGAVLLNEEVRKKVKARIVVYLMLSEKCKDEDFMQNTFQELERKAPKQLELFMHFLNLTTGDKRTKYISRSKLLKASNSNAATLNGLIKKGVFELFESSEFDSPEKQDGLAEKNPLNEIQSAAFNDINKEFENQNVVLLHGVTSSGKTEVFVHLIEEQIKKGKQVLYLLPEIALTTQMIVRLRKYFGDNLLIYHSRYNENERLQTWNRMLRYDMERKQNENAFQVIIGARSAVFLPYTNLGLIIVDEEHEPSYKQFDPAPRYHARDTAVVLGNIFKAKVILGSATPSLESYHNALEHKYGLVEMNKRYADMELPLIKVVDMKEAYRRKKMKASFSEDMLNDLREALKQNEQAILFQNRRGFATILQCKQCAWIPGCINCDVSLTYHKNSNVLLCHYCGYKMNVPQTCKACKSNDIRMSGIGTERLEEDLAVFFPEKKIARLDIDTARTRHQYQQILNDFEHGAIDILVGTQMVTKGLDFDNVSTVGVINADSLMSYPDFRSSERAFQLMSQVSGRSGRKKKRGEVIVQTFNPASHVISFVVSHDFKGFYNMESEERKKFNYPPFCRIIEIAVKHKEQKTADEGAHHLATLLRQQFAKRVLGPVMPVVSRVNNYYIRQIILKIEKDISVKEAKKRLTECILQTTIMPSYKNCYISIDVDPS